MDELRYQIDLLNAMNERIQAEERMYRLVCETSLDAYIYIELTHKNIKTLGCFNDFFPGLEIKDVSDLIKIYSLVEEQSVLLLRDLLCRDTETVNGATATFKLKDDNRFLEVKVTIISDEKGNPTDKIVRFRDITKIKYNNDELTYMAYYDMVTGLYNRNYFVRLLSDYISKAERENALVSVMFIDLDDFHSLNDGMGMETGDEIVQQFGQMLGDFKGDNVVISHFNADMYCVAIYEPQGNRTCDYIYRNLLEKVKSPYRLLNGREVLLSFCAGVAEYPEAASNALELINCAEIVMLKAKKKGRGEIQYFDANILTEFIKNVSIENKLKEAVFSQNFVMNFQPQYYSNTRELRGVEALIRWKDNDGKMISPALFIPIAEKNGSIIPIGNFVIDESIRIYSRWVRDYDASFILSLNISAIQFRTENFTENFLDIISKYDVSPENIELEVTESVLIDDFKDVVDKLILLREYGIRISLDDFGTGYSSLAYLKGLPIDTLKIDKSFVDTITTDENARIILESIVFMSKKLGFETIAEGVETQKQFDYICHVGCDCTQGFFLGKPMDQRAVEDLIRQ